jgi:hypothetical protein
MRPPFRLRRLWPVLPVLAALALGAAFHSPAQAAATDVAAPAGAAVAYLTLPAPQTPRPGLISIDISRPDSLASTSPSGAGPAAPAAAPAVVDRSGPVQTAPRIYVVFVGSQWQDGPNSPAAAAIAATLTLYRGVGAGGYNGVLSQYRGAGASPALVAAWIDPQAPAATVNPLSDVARIIAAAAIPAGDNTQVDLIYPPGYTFTTPSDASATGYHSQASGVTYAAISSLPGDTGSLTVAESHEYDETVSDPLGDIAPDTGISNPAFAFGSTQSGRPLAEVADVCEDETPAVSGGIALARIYDAQNQACVAPTLAG